MLICACLQLLGIQIPFHWSEVGLPRGWSWFCTSDTIHGLPGWPDFDLA